MKCDVVFHEAYPFALDGARDDHSGSAFPLLGSLVGGQNLLEVMSVCINGVPAEGLPFLGKRLEVHDVSSPAAELDAVVVNYSCQVIQFGVGC